MGNGGSKGGGSGSGNSGNKGSSGNGSSGRTTIDINCGHDFQGRQESHSKNCPMYKGYPSAHSNSKGGEGGYKGSQGSQTAQGSHGSFSGVKSIQAFENSFDNTGIMNCEGSSPHNINELSSLINIRSTMQPGWGANVFAKVKILNLSHSNLSGTQLSPLFQSMYYQKMDMDLLDLSFNKMCDNSVGEMLWSIGNEAGKQIHAIRCLKINNNEFSDKSAEYFTWHLNSGSLKYTKVLDVSGNQITKTGTGYFLDALKNSNVGNIIIKQYHLSVFGNKESKIGFMKDYLKQAQDKGVDVKNIVVDKSLTGYIKTTSKVVKDVAIGFAKCYYVDDAVTDYAADKIIAKVSKTFGMLWDGKDLVNCYAESFDDVMVSKLGVELIKSDLEIMGEATFTNAIE